MLFLGPSALRRFPTAIHDDLLPSSLAHLNQALIILVMHPCTVLLSWWNELWEATQVELQGHYAIEHLRDFDQYRKQTSWLRAVVVCLLTPLPCIIMVVLIDVLPLEPLASGPWYSPNVWVRTFLTVLQIGLCVLEQLKTHVPQLELGRKLLVFISICAAATSVGGCFTLAILIGYPVPFMMIVGSVPWAIAIVVTLYIFKRQRIRECPDLMSRMWRYMLVFACQIAMTVVYPLFNHAYKTMSPSQQTAFVFLLPVIKIVAKNWISRTLPDVDNAKPEAVVFNVEIFHSLFVSLCMGNTTSSRTVLALMAVDLVQAWLSFMDVRSILRSLYQIADKLDNIRKRVESTMSRSRHGLQHLVSLSNTIIDVEPFQARQATRSRDQLRQRKWTYLFDRLKSRSRVRSVVPASALKLTPLAPVVATNVPPKPLPAGSDITTTTDEFTLAPSAYNPLSAKTLPTDIASLNVIERGALVRQTQKMLFVTEFIVLIEYTEVIVPLMYVIVVSSMHYLPNAIYYPFLEDVTTASDLISNVILYASLEFVSLLLMGVIMWWWIRLSLVHQLAFVLERRAATIQTKLLLWMLYTVQNTVIQLGPDYTFRFEWLKR